MALKYETRIDYYYSLKAPGNLICNNKNLSLSAFFLASPTVDMMLLFKDELLLSLRALGDLREV